MENKHGMTAVHFKFAPAALECRDALSAIVQIGDTLWVANDESIHLERLSYQGSDADGNPLYAAHTRFALHDYLSLPVAADADDNEVDRTNSFGARRWSSGIASTGSAFAVTS